MWSRRASLRAFRRMLSPSAVRPSAIISHRSPVCPTKWRRYHREFNHIRAGRGDSGRVRFGGAQSLN
jgi:hypothetical protein